VYESTKITSVVGKLYTELYGTATGETHESGTAITVDGANSIVVTSSYTIAGLYVVDDQYQSSISSVGVE
jgi:hypothetical protein